MHRLINITSFNGVMMNIFNFLQHHRLILDQLRILVPMLRVGMHLATNICLYRLAQLRLHNFAHWSNANAQLDQHNLV
ncbi:MAG: hypothetical protein ACJAZP_000135 [Psychromonas sp.]|jgi:hypothetical protein